MQKSGRFRGRGIGAFLCVCGFVCGCSHFDGRAVRREHAEGYPVALAKRTELELSAREPLDLQDCVDIAIRNNMSIRQAEIEASVVSLERNVAFANFLPVVEVSGQTTSADRQPMRSAGADSTGDNLYAATQDRSVQTGAIQLQWSIFRPSTWFLYSARRRGEEIGALMRDFTRQRIRMEITAQYYQCLSLREACQAAESQEAVAKKALEDAMAKYREGLVNDVQLKEVGIYLLQCETDSERLQRAETVAQADLMVLMGLLPVRPCRLAGSTPLNAPALTLEDMVSQGLLHHPQLRISDREVEINRQMVKSAIADFLPSLVGTGGFAYASDSFMKYSRSWTWGLSGVMTVFNGFANVNQYRIARERGKTAGLQREEMCLSVILQILRAHSALGDAQRNAELAKQNVKLAALRLADVQKKWREGLLSPVEPLRAEASCAAASRDHSAADYNVQVSAAALYHAMGMYGDQDEYFEGTSP